MLSRPVDPHVACKASSWPEETSHMGQGTEGAMSMADAALDFQIALLLWASDAQRAQSCKSDLISYF